LTSKSSQPKAYFVAGTRRFSSSNQFSTTLDLRGSLRLLSRLEHQKALAVAELRVGGELRGEDLIATMRSSRVARTL
jgi:hypothetical protein